MADMVPPPGLPSPAASVSWLSAGGLGVRRIEPELLDVLPVHAPEAIASRRDLVRVNLLMLQRSLMRGLLLRHVAQPPRRILEIGAGDGRFMLAVARGLARRWPGVEVVMVDRQPLLGADLADAFARLGWRVVPVAADVFQWAAEARRERFDAVAANLFLHHFGDDDLRRLFGMLQPMAPLLVATEPRRGRFALLAARLLPLVGANRVTLNDAAASVRAGFRRGELSSFWPGRAVEDRNAGPFSIAFAAGGAS